MFTLWLTQLEEVRPGSEACEANGEAMEYPTFKEAMDVARSNSRAIRIVNLQREICWERGRPLPSW